MSNLFFIVFAIFFYYYPVFNVLLNVKDIQNQTRKHNFLSLERR